MPNITNELRENPSETQNFHEQIKMFFEDPTNIQYLRNICFNTLDWRTLQTAVVDDIIQDVIVRALSHASDLKKETSLRAWITTITVNRCLNEFRERERHPTVPLEDLNQNENGNGQNGHDDYSERILYRQEKNKNGNGNIEQNIITKLTLEKIKNKLEEIYWQILYFRDIQELSYEEISKETGIPEKTLRVRHLRAMKKAQNLITKTILK